ncbi:MAG: response regulator [Gammaproteobacteria bacterium]|nr:response regulator [Gammaproteobacteria bacterium]MDH5802674.1 response regulator [Gammaproteobacteria bacterium]
MKHILSADDDITNRMIIEEILDEEYVVTSVENGQECLKSIEEKLPDLVLLDVSMPIMDGIEVCKKLRSNKKTENLPIIMLSGFAANDNVAKGFSVGANEYITKPFEPSVLRQTISRLLANPSD